MKRKPSLKSLRAKLDKVFSLYIRRRDTEKWDGWYGRCVTCRTPYHWSDCHAGHFIPRQYVATRYDERNVHLQCVKCNTFRHGALTEYTMFMLKTYGEKVVEELMQAKHKTVKFTRSDYEEMIKRFS